MSTLTSSTILHPPWLNLARTAWMIVSIASLIVFIIGGYQVIQAPLPNCQAEEVVCGPWNLSQGDIGLAQQSGLPVSTMLFIFYLNSILPKIFFFLVGLVIFLRKSDDWMALILSIMLTGFATEGITELGIFTPLVAGMYAIASGAFILLPFVFPNGRIEPDWMRWVAPFVFMLAIFASLLQYASATISEGFLALVMLTAYGAWFISGGYAFIYRYRYTFNPIEKQQTKWVMVSILGQIITFVPFTIISLFFPPSQSSLPRLAVFYFIWLPTGFTSYLLLSAGIAFAILRYKLWDIDIVIRRTLQYTLVTGTLGLVYLGGVTVLQGVFTAVSGQQSPAAVVLSTLGIAALFNPLRRRVQDFIDRRFYRRKYDAEKALAEFAATARSETDLEHLSERLTHTVQETLQPEKVNLWIRTSKS